MESLVHAMLSNALAVTVMAVLVAALACACRRPALIHGLWLVVLLKLVTPPFVPVSLPAIEGIVSASTFAGETDSDRGIEPVPPDESRVDLEPLVNEEWVFADTSASTGPAVPALPSADSVPDGGTDMPTRASTPWPSVLLSLPAGWTWEHVVLFVIVAGALAWWALAAVRIVWFQRLLRNLQPVPAEWRSCVDELAARLALSRSPKVFVVPGRVPPMLWAIGGRARLLVPSELWSATSADERTSLLLHELAHLKRRDHWVRWLELLVGGLYWWHPVVWWIRRWLREAEEQCCDAWVVWAMPEGAKTYAAALLTALEFVSGGRTAPLAASATSGNGHISSLKRRMRMILRAKTPKGLSWAGFCTVLGTAALLLPLAPTWAQRNEADQPAVGPELADELDMVDDALGLVVRDLLDQEVKGNDVAAAVELPGQDDQELEAAIQNEFRKDPDVARLVKTIREARVKLDQNRSVAGNRNDPSLRATRKELQSSMEEYERFWLVKRAEIRNRLAQRSNTSLARSNQDNDEPDARKDADRGEQGRTTPERLEQRVKDLIARIQRELGPSFDEVQKALEKSMDDLHKALEKQDVSLDDLRKSMEKSYDEIRQALSQGGPVDKELREGWERSRRELRDTWMRSREEMRQDLRSRVEAARRRQRDFGRAARDSRDQGKAEGEKGAAAKSQERPSEDELDSARKEVRDLQQQLSRATRRLAELQRRLNQSNAAQRRAYELFGRRAPERDQREENAQRGADSQSRRSPESGRTPSESRRSPESGRTPTAPKAVTPPSSRTPASPDRDSAAGGGGGARGPGNFGRNPEYDRRFRELDDKLDRLLKELEKLKQGADSKSKDSSTRSRQPAKPGATRV